MLLIPVGAEGDDPKKPVVTIALIALNALWFALLYLTPGAYSWTADVETARASVRQYWSEHPRLPPPETLLRVLGSDGVAELAEEAKASPQGRTPAMGWLDDLDRLELDRRARQLEAALAKRPTMRWGFIPGHPTLVGLFMSLFTHAGLLHFAGNMLFLWAVGPFVERALGPMLFGALYLVSGIVASLVHALASGDVSMPLVGASGAIAGVMGALLVARARANIRFLFVPIVFMPKFRFLFGIPAFVVLPLWFLEQLSSARVEPDAPVAWWAHIGGFVFGMAAGAALVRVVKARAAKAPVRRTPTQPVKARPFGGTGAFGVSPGLKPVRAKLRIAVVSNGGGGQVVVHNARKILLKRELSAAEAGALAFDDVIELLPGPLDLRVEIRSPDGTVRHGAAPVVLRLGETRILRVEPRPAMLHVDVR